MANNQINNTYQILVSFFFEIGTLRKIARSHRQVLLTDDLSDNIASHSYRVAIIGLFLSKLEKVDPYKVLVMCLLHDIEETRAGDQNWVHKKFVKVFEDEIREGQLRSLPASGDLLSISNEYHERKTKEARIAKDADLLDQILLLKEYTLQGNKEAESWLKGRSWKKMIFSFSAKKFAREEIKQRPSEWWNNLWTSKRR